MKQLHWSQIYVTFITIEVTYADSARQGWDYDCSKFSTMQDMKANMIADFVNRRDDWGGVFLHFSINDANYSGELPVPDWTNAEDFTNSILEYIGDVLGWQQAAIS